MVIIEYPGKSALYDPTGFPLASKTHLVHSEKLLATGSKFFEMQLKDSRQQRVRKRTGFHNGLPEGIKYILDLTPPDEGDAAVDLTSELSCSVGIRNWYSAEFRCGVSHSIVGGKDEVTKPVFFLEDEPALINHHGSGAVKNSDFEGFHNMSERSSYPEANSSLLRRTGEEFPDIALNHAIEMSKRDYLTTSRANGQASSHSDRGSFRVEEILEYCPIRHRAGIERILQAIEGKDPRLDSAPKVWTFFVLSKYFDCTKVSVSCSSLHSFSIAKFVLLD